MGKVMLKKGKEVAVRRFHPWVFSGAIARTEGEPADGDPVEVISHSGEFLALGYYQGGSSIAVRLLSFAKVPLDEAFWSAKLKDALRYRASLGLSWRPGTDAFRWVHGEGDGLPGLIIDVYGEVAVIQCHTIGMHRFRMSVAEALPAVSGGRIAAVYDKSRETLPKPYQATVSNGYLIGHAGPGTIHENGLSFLVDWETGQKTGFFLDQRDNRRLLQQYAADRRVLNLFCYSGAFSVYALAGGAREVCSVDASARAIGWARENLSRNGYDAEAHPLVNSDVMPFLREAGPYELLVVDPPAFAKNLSQRHQAVQGYKRLNEAALACAAPGAIVFTFSCSQAIDRQLFYDTITAAAISAGRPVRVAHHLSQAADHPVSMFHPEGSYLKGLVLVVD
ncbi:MAG: hypothetical protein RLY31_278 [Bacteroidota bacterium]